MQRPRHDRAIASLGTIVYLLICSRGPGVLRSLSGRPYGTTLGYGQLFVAPSQLAGCVDNVVSRRTTEKETKRNYQTHIEKNEGPLRSITYFLAGVFEVAALALVACLREYLHTADEKEIAWLSCGLLFRIARS
jgi:hypothetical protein